ncbi:uncharacterized protein LOC121873765 [Homarus americanus]|uniref:uncharacterized protein LOC121873765 n=1 Tax=Homarus americanus TaxID=6706 RepID=UPI001C486C86|nr:uncharacterized protein LOC121873765 [Homarus americanus]
MLTSTAATGVLVYDDGGGERRPSLPRRLRRVVPQGPPPGVVDEAPRRHTPAPLGGAKPPDLPLDFLYDEHHVGYLGTDVKATQFQCVCQPPVHNVWGQNSENGILDDESWPGTDKQIPPFP